MIIDAHHHLWRFDPAEYGWIGERDTVLRRDFLLPELAAMATTSGLAGTVVVQARQSLEETRWLLGLARQAPSAHQKPLIRGVVAWVPLADPGLAAIIEDVAWASPPMQTHAHGQDARATVAWASSPMQTHAHGQDARATCLVGVRHVVQGESDPGFLLRPAIQRGLAEVARRGLAYDLLITARQLPQAIRCVEAQAGAGRFILDHGGKPDIRGRGLAAWAADLTRLARHPNVACKLSGLITEANPAAWTVAELTPYVRAILDAFGPRRVLFGSDWPVCLLGASHRRWLDAVGAWISACTPAEQAAILGGNAVTWYSLELP